VMPHWEADAY
jgi:peptidyl-dipeptidase A